MAERLASLSWQGSLGSMTVLGGFLGAWSGRRGASLGVVAGRGLVYAMATGALTLVLLAMTFAGLRRLSSSERRMVIDAVRFGQSVGDPRLVDTLLRFTTKKRKLLSRSVTTANIVTFLFVAGLCVFAAVLTARVGAVADALVFAGLGVGCLWLAVIWPAAVKATRRNIEAAERAALSLRLGAEPLTSGR